MAYPWTLGDGGRCCGDAKLAAQDASLLPPGVAEQLQELLGDTGFKTKAAEGLLQWVQEQGGELVEADMLDDMVCRGRLSLWWCLKGTLML